MNNLDLSLLPPGAAFAIFGNNNASSPSQSPDGRNNVEKIELRAPVPTLNADGSRARAPYAATVRGAAVPLGPKQAYSVVVTGPGLSLAAAGSCGSSGAGAAASAPLPAAAVAAISSLAVAAAFLAAAVAYLLYLRKQTGKVSFESAASERTPFYQLGAPRAVTSMNPLPAALGP